MSKIEKCPLCGKAPCSYVTGDGILCKIECCDYSIATPFNARQQWNQYATLRAENERLKGEVERLRDFLGVIVLNAVVGPDVAMRGATDCYHVPTDDIDTAKAYLACP